ncbi:MAG TPA: DUF3313 family protein [Woeseiaceae bacterium]|nr:DUF3313 family protein [Woeseiaceae bacterium]
MNALIALLALSVPLTLFAAMPADMPAVSHDGLVLQKDTRAAVVYLKPGASLGGYDKVQLLPCFVAFQKDWQVQQNKTPMMRQKVTDNDMQRIRDSLSKEFNRVFTEELKKDGGYEVVDRPGSNVLLVKPAIIDLVVTAPAVRPSDNLQSQRTSAGAMTLYAELYDSVSGDIIARVIDPQVSRDADFEMRDARLVNREEADKILRKWADGLRQKIDTVN